MYFYIPQNQVPEKNPMYAGFLDAINIASFLIGLQNLELNITAQDMDDQTQTILDDLHGYLDKQDKHLSEQDKHLASQDEHLLMQDMRLDKLERLLYDKDNIERKESLR